MKNKAKVTSIEKVIQAYHNHRFRIHDILEDGQFKPIQHITYALPMNMYQKSKGI